MPRDVAHAWQTAACTSIPTCSPLTNCKSTSKNPPEGNMFSTIPTDFLVRGTIYFSVMKKESVTFSEPMCPRNFQEIYTTHIRKTYTRWKIPLRRLLVRRYGRRDLSLTQNDTSSSTSVLNFAWNHIIWSWLKFLHTKRSMSLRCSRYTRPRTPSPKSYTCFHFIKGRY